MTPMPTIQRDQMPFSFPRSMLHFIVSVQLWQGGSISLQLINDPGSWTFCSHSLDLPFRIVFFWDEYWMTFSPTAQCTCRWRSYRLYVVFCSSVHIFFFKFCLSWNFQPFHVCCPWISTESVCLSVTDSTPPCQGDKGFLTLP